MNFIRNIFLISTFILALLSSWTKAEELEKPKRIKIACVGNSITYGDGVANREKNNYPFQLEEMLGDTYEVENFGVSGATLLKKGDYPYWETGAYKNSLEFMPDIVFIELGTNDSRQKNRVFLDAFETDYETLINDFKKKNKNIRIVLLLPVPSFLEDSTSIYDPIIKENIIPKTQQIAYKTNTEVIDLYQLLIDKPNLFPDKIHPSSLGATIIAKRLYEVVVREKAKKKVNIFDNSALQSGEQSNFHGYQLTSFKLDGVECKLVRPKRIARDAPWVLRARFWGHEPQTDIALLERGFHIAYCDVANLFGSPQAVRRWDAFYEMMTNAGFSRKVVLEGMSRGGLIIYNWAEQNPEKVACIYADAPVLDGKSWPGGLGKGEGSEVDWENFKKIYGLDSETSVAAFKGSPINKTKAIAQGGYPMLHVVGTIDTTVPVVENTDAFEKGIKANGGNIKVIYKDSVGHHPHSLQNPTLIVDFILRATHQKINFAIIPAPSAEYRSAAGWVEGKDWWAQAQDIDSLCKTSGKTNLLLIGNSITQGFGGNRPHVTHHPGRAAAKIHFKDIKWINAGISGDRTEHVLWRLENGSYEKANPDIVVLTLGVNNIPFQNAEEIVAGIEKMLKITKKKFSNSKIILFGPLPTGRR